jgi:spermidine dehydrogenase
LQFMRRAGPHMRCIVLENHPIFGGEAKQNVFDVDGKPLVAHQGSAMYFVQLPYSGLAEFYDSIGLREPVLAYQRWGGADPPMPLATTPYDSVGIERGQYGFWFGDRWVLDPIAGRFADAPVPAQTKPQLYRWFAGEPVEAKPFTPPVYEGDATSRYLDSITLEEHYMERYDLTREFVRRYLSPVEGGGSGLGPDALSAYSDYAADMLHPQSGDDASQMFPGGNTTIARLIAKALIPSAIPGDASVEGVTRGSVDPAQLDRDGSPARVRLGVTVVSVKHDGDPANAQTVGIAYARGGRVYALRARCVVVAGGCWTAKHILKDLPQQLRDAYDQFYRSPCLVANVALRNWRFLYDHGLSGGRSFSGFVNHFNVRKLALTGVTDPAITPDSPIVLTLKKIFPYPGLTTQEQGINGRVELLGTSFHDYETQIRDEFTQMFARWGFDARRDIAGIILNRWGHAYLSPQPGFFFGTDGRPSPRDVLRAAPFGRIAFANTDLTGCMDHRYSILEAQRAVGQLLGQVLD